MTAADGGPFVGCELYTVTNNESATSDTYHVHLDHPERTSFRWLFNGLAYSGRSVVHVIYMSILFTLAALSRAIFKRTSMLHGGKLTANTHVIILVLVGMLLSGITVLWRSYSTQECLRGAWMLSDSESNISIFYFGILPLFLFKPSFDLDYNFVLRNIDTIVILGGGSLVAVVTIMTVFVVGSIEPFTEIAMDSTDYPDYGEFRSFAMAGLLAVIIGLSDSSLILGLLKEVGGKNNRLSALIENGSWVAACIGTTLFEIFRISVQSTETWTHGAWISCITWKILLSPFFGFLASKTVSRVVRLILNDPLAESLMIFSALYITFCVSNLFGLSGPITIMLFNLFFDHSQLSREAEVSIKKFSETLSFFAAIYLAGSTGFVFVEQLADHIHASPDMVSVYKDLFWMFMIYIMVLVVRFLVLQAVSFTVNSDTIRWKECILMTMGEVRGPINITLAFIVLLDPEMSWIQHCPDGHLDGARAFSQYDQRTIGSCGGDMLNLNVTINTPISQKTKMFNLSELYRISQQKIFFYSVGVIILTQIINALSLDKITEKLGIYQITSGQKNTMTNAISRIKNDVAKSCLIMQYDPFLTDADWDLVGAKSMIAYPYKNNPNKRKLSRDNSLKTDDFLSPDESTTSAHDMEEARQRVLNALKTSFAKQRKEGLINDDAVTVLNQSVNSVQNEQQTVQFVALSQLSRNWKLTGFLPKIASLIDGYLYNSKDRIVRNTWRKQFLRKLHRVALSDGFEVFMQLVILGNLVTMIIENTLEARAVATNDWTNGLLPTTIIEGLSADEMQEKVELLHKQDEYCKDMFSGAMCTSDSIELTNTVFLLIYIFDCLFKIGILSLKEYWSFAWNKFDCLIVIISVIEFIVSLIINEVVQAEVSKIDTNATGSIQVLKLFKILKMVKVLKVVRTFRSVRLLRFSRTVVPYGVKWLNNKINEKMSFGYDVGRGFVRGVEELESIIDMIAGDNFIIRKRLRKIAQKSKSIVARDLGLLQKNYPGIATSVKTRTAIRNLINVMFSSVNRLQSGGVLDDFEVQVLRDQINILIKGTAEVPLVMKSVPEENLFQNIPWVNGDKELAKFLMDNSIVTDFDLGDIIVQDDEEPDSIFLIIKGLLKIIHGEYRPDMFESDMSLGKLENQDSDDEDLEDITVDYASTGLVIGELGCLIGESAGISAICETSVSAFQIPVETIRLAFEKFPRLKDQLWKVVGMKIAVPLLQKDIKWSGFTADEVRMHLQGSTVLSLGRDEEFKLDDQINDCILIDGWVIQQDEEIESPAIIHHLEADRVGYGSEIQDSTLTIPERAVLLILKKKREEVRALESRKTESRKTDERKTLRTSNRNRAPIQEPEMTSRTSFNSVQIDQARRQYMQEKFQNKAEVLMEETEDLNETASSIEMRRR